MIAFRNTDETTAYVFGDGVYVGDELRPGWQATLASVEDREIAERALRRNDEADRAADRESWYLDRVAAGQMTEEERQANLASLDAYVQAELAKPMPQRVDEMLKSMLRNPKIVLDDGAGVVWGCECWWGPADDLRAQRLLATLKVVTVPAPHPAESSAPTDTGDQHV